MRILEEETFGPVAPIVRFEREDEAVAAANGTPFGLAAYLWTRDLSRAFRVSEALDFGIVGQLPARDQYFLAENFMAVFQRDYRRIAELHVEAGWMPANVRIDELEAACRSVCEPYFSRPLSAQALKDFCRAPRPPWSPVALA